MTDDLADKYGEAAITTGRRLQPTSFERRLMLRDNLDPHFTKLWLDFGMAGLVQRVGANGSRGKRVARSLYRSTKRHLNLDEKAMVEILTDEMKESGARLLQEMEAAGMRPEAAFWLYDPEREEWELTLADPSVADGSMDKYRRIQQLLLQYPEKFKELPLHHIALVKPTSPVVKGLRRGLGTGPDVFGLRVRNAYYGTFIEGAYIYRLN